MSESVLIIGAGTGLSASLARLCASEDMKVVHKAYKYIKEQMLNANYIITYEDLEEEFQKFCKEQEIKPPPFPAIFEETNDFVRKFNEEFESNENIINNKGLSNKSSGWFSWLFG